MLVSDFHFDLPEELIAQHPPAVRGSSRMLVLDRGLARRGPVEAALTDSVFTRLPGHLAPGDLLVLNDSRVLPARLFATRAGLATQQGSPRPSGAIEVLLTEQAEPGSPSLWRALVRPARKVQPGERLLFHAPGKRAGEPVLTAEVIAAGEFGERTLRFAPVDDLLARIDRIGHMPLPPYIRRDQAAGPDDEEDKARYQTVYAQSWAQEPGAQEPGSAAAPTAGLHFTPEVLEALAGRGVEIAALTLHVGLGTFQPVRVAEVGAIRLHAERYTLPAATAEALNRARRDGRRIVAVGTTTTRTLEHIALEAERAGGGPELQPHSGSTSIFIASGHRFRVVSGLVTNFHLPESTLLMLVSAFAADAGDADTGRRTVLAAYAHAIRERYRFFSYGDCMLLL